MAYDKVVDSQALDGALGAVADAIRGKTGSAATLTLEQMPGAISGIQTGGGAVLPELSNPGSAGDLMEGKQLLDGDGVPVTGTFTIAPELAEQTALIDQIKTALAWKTIPSAGLPTQEKTVEITENGEYEIVPDDGYTLSKVVATVNVMGGDPELPPGWWRCDYIKFAGKQIVDTGRKCTRNTQIRIDFTRDRSTQHYLYGVTSPDNMASVTAYLGGSWRFGNKSTTKTITTRSDMVYSAIVSSSETTITGSDTSLSSVNEFETVGSLLIGTCRSASGAVGDPQFEGKIMRFQMDDEGEPVLNLVPVTDGTAFRFWDSVGKKFHDSITDTPLAGGNW